MKVKIFSVEDYDYWLKLAYNNAKFYFPKNIRSLLL